MKRVLAVPAMLLAVAASALAGEGYDYDALTQEALRGVIHDVLTDAAVNGLAGEHHFFIKFDTNAPGVFVPMRLREKHGADMTIALQHEFHDLRTSDEGFEVKLRFDGVQEQLYVPYSAILGFFDPSASFGLSFEADSDAPAGGDGDAKDRALEDGQ